MPRTLIQFSQTILKLTREKKYLDALNHFKENKSAFSSKEIGGNSYLVSAMINALRCTNKIDPAFKFLELYKVAINNNTDEYILIPYGWLLYDKYKSENHLANNHESETDAFDDEEVIDENDNSIISKSETVKLIEEVVPLLLKYDTIYSYSVCSKLFNIVPKVEKKKANTNWKLVNEFCDLIPSNRLKTDCESREVEKKDRLVQMEFASDRENWYAYKSRALMQLGKYQECLDISKTALETFKKFHYSNDIWFKRLIALAKMKLGNSEDAIKELQQILVRKKEWFIQKELAELFKEVGNTDSAFNLAIEAINNSGDLELKINLIVLIGELLKSKNEDDLAFKHFSLSRLIRINKGWKVPFRLSSALGQIGRDDVPIEKLQELKSELTMYWNSLKPQRNYSSGKRQKGKSNSS